MAAVPAYIAVVAAPTQARTHCQRRRQPVVRTHAQAIGLEIHAVGVGLPVQAAGADRTAHPQAQVALALRTAVAAARHRRRITELVVGILGVRAARLRADAAIGLAAMRGRLEGHCIAQRAAATVGGFQTALEVVDLRLSKAPRRLGLRIDQATHFRIHTRVSRGATVKVTLAAAEVANALDKVNCTVA